MINTSNLYVGGGLQVALSFIHELRELKFKHQYYVFLSHAAKEQINHNLFTDNFHFYLIEKSPSSLIDRKEMISKLDTLEKEIKPDIIFSVFGPTFWTPKTLHIMGFALPWLINPESAAFSELPFLKRLKKRIEIKYKAYHVKNNADYYVVETEYTKMRLARFYSIAENNIFVVGNTYNAFFDQIEYKKIEFPERTSNEFRMITISHNYPHKNLKVIKEVIPYLKKQKLDYKFVLTIDKQSYEVLFSDVKDYVVNLEPINSDLCPSAYEQCDILFLPTLLECFTASYPEAMKMRKPILTSNLSFAKDICQNAALYFDPLNPKDIANKIIKLSIDQQFQKELILKGVERLQHFETAESRAIKYVEICEKIAK